MTVTNDGNQAPNKFWRTVGTMLKVLLRLLVILILGILIAVGLYYGVPWTYRTLVRPVQEQAARIAALEQRITQEQDRTRTELRRFQERLTTLEEELQDAREENARHAASLSLQEEALDAAMERIETLEGQLATLEDELQAREEALDALQEELAEALTAMEGREEGIAAQVDRLSGRLALLQTAQDLLRVRLFLLEENPRAAIEALALADAHLERASLLMPEQATALAALQDRVGALQGLIEARSFRVGLELEALWAELVELALPAPVTTTETTLEVTPGLSPLPTPSAP